MEATGTHTDGTHTDGTHTGGTHTGGTHTGGTRTDGYVLLVWSPHGYTLRELEGDPPPVGQQIQDDGRTLVVTKVGSSPLPGDPRRCAYSLGR